METGSIIKAVMPIMGVVMMVSSIWLLAVKRMTADFTVIWEIAGVALVLIGWIPGFVIWIEGTVFYIVTLGMFLCYFFSLFLSCLFMRSHELAIETSILLQEKDDENTGKELLIILPVKNEEKNIGRVLKGLSEPEIREIADILCINDASADRSGQIIGQYSCAQIVNVFELGYGSALQVGYKYAVRKGYRYVIQMDADGQHDVCNIPLLYGKLREKGTDGKEPDIVLASRFMDGSSEFPVSLCKRMAFALFRSMIRAATGRRIADPTTGLQGLSREAFTYYAQYSNFDHQYPDANMVLKMLLLRFQLTEMPAVMHARTDGKSMHAGLEPLWYMPRMFFSILAVIFRIKILQLG